MLASLLISRTVIALARSRANGVDHFLLSKVLLQRRVLFLRISCCSRRPNWRLVTEFIVFLGSGRRLCRVRDSLVFRDLQFLRRRSGLHVTLSANKPGIAVELEVGRNE